MRINFIALLWFAIGVLPVIGGFDFLPSRHFDAPPTVEGERTNISANGGIITVPDGGS